MQSAMNKKTLPIILLFPDDAKTISDLYQNDGNFQDTCSDFNLCTLMLFIATMNVQETQEDLAKASQNPLANLMSFPFQNNTNFVPESQLRLQATLMLPTSILKKSAPATTTK